MITRQKINEREELSYDEKERIAKKSGHRCCHCGKEVYFGYGATVEHFVPISKGGTNRDINLVMLCKDCNESKGDLIIPPRDYLSYLEQEHLEKLKGYFESYTKSFEYLSRGNLLSCDEYKIYVEPCYGYEQNRRRFKNRLNRPVNNYVLLKKATIDDIPRLVDYFSSYCKKYDCFKNRETADLNIRFWFQFGCIYYVQAADGIKSMAAVTVTDLEGIVGLKQCTHVLSMFVFTYYDTPQAYTLCKGLIYEIPRRIMKEQELKQLPVRLSMVKGDNITDYAMADMGTIYTDDVMAHQHMVLSFEGDDPENETGEDPALISFFEKFTNVRDEVTGWIKHQDDVDWMEASLYIS